MKIIGLTGGIASGKSTVSSYLKDKGYKIVDADLIARKVVMPHTYGFERLVENFGENIIASDGSLDRKKLGSIVFNDSKKLQVLNSILHPIIREHIMLEFHKHRESNEKIVIFDCPLLFETDYQKICDQTWLVSVTYETQIKRLRLRDNIDNLHAKKIVGSQMPLKRKAELADIVIDNEKDIENLYKSIDKLLINIFK